MYGPARFASGHRRRVQRRRARLANPVARHGIPAAAVVVDQVATAAAWTSPTGLPDAGLTATEPT